MPVAKFQEIASNNSRLLGDPVSLNNDQPGAYSLFMQQTFIEQLICTRPCAGAGGQSSLQRVVCSRGFCLPGNDPVPVLEGVLALLCGLGRNVSHVPCSLLSCLPVCM